MNGVLLRIFSGQHLGAEIELPDGEIVIGTDDSCDIILSDPSLSGRHAVLRASTSSEPPSLQAEALDGAVILDGAEVSGPCDIPQAHPFLLGTVFLAWAPASADHAAAWDNVRSALTVRSSAAPSPSESPDPGAGTPADEPDPEEPHDNAVAADASSDDDNANVAGAPAGPALEPLPEAKPRSGTSFLLKGLVAAAAFLAALLLCFSWERRPEEDHREIVQRLLREAGYEKLSVTGNNGSVTISGRIASDSERGRILRLAQFLQFPVYLNLNVRSDAAEAVRSSYNAMGLYPEVTELPPSAHPGLLVRGYIRDGILEEQALQQARRNVPDLQQKGGDPKAALDIFSDIRHMEDVKTILEPALAAKGMRDAASIEYLPGRIVIHGALTPQTRTTLSDIAASIQQKLDVPIPMDIVNGFQAQAQKPHAGTAGTASGKPGEKHIRIEFSGPKRTGETTRQETAQAAPPKAAPPTAEAPMPPSPSELLLPRGFKVTSVSMGALRFITLDNGERLFEGGELPGGYIVEGISVDELKLSKDGKKTTYPLRGKHE